MKLRASQAIAEVSELLLAEEARAGLHRRAVHFHISTDYELLLPSRIVNERMGRLASGHHDRRTIEEASSVRRGTLLDVVVLRPDHRVLVLSKEHYAHRYEPVRTMMLNANYVVRSFHDTAWRTEGLEFLDGYRDRYLERLRREYVAEAETEGITDVDVDQVVVSEGSGESLELISLIPVNTVEDGLEFEARAAVKTEAGLCVMKTAPIEEEEEEVEVETAVDVI